MYYLLTYVMYAVQTVVHVCSQPVSPQGHFEEIFSFINVCKYIYYQQVTSYKLAFIHRLFISRYKILVKFSCYV